MKVFTYWPAMLPLETARESLMKNVALETCLPELERERTRPQKVCKRKTERSFVAFH